MANIGTAYVDVEGNFDPLERGTKRAVDQMLARLRDAGILNVRGDFTQLEADSKKAASKVEGNLQDAGDVKGTADFSEVEKESKRAGDKLKLGLAAAGAIAGAALAKGIGDAMDIEVANDKLAAQLGLSAKESKRLGRISGDLYANAYGDSLGEVNEAVKGVVQNVGGMAKANEKDLSRVTASVIDVSKAFDEDLGATSAAVGQLLRTGLAKDADEALDIITVGLQSGANKADDLLDTFNEYGTQFRKFGLDGQTATGLLSQGLKAGARDADIVADSIKEFGIRAIDGSDTTKKAYADLGLSASKMTEQIAAGGPKAGTALDTVLDRLRAVKDPAERSGIAVSLFGTQAEDMGDALYALDPSKAVDSIGKVGGAAQKMGDTLNSNTKGSLETFKRQGLMALARFCDETLRPALGRVSDFLNRTLVPVFQSAGEEGSSLNDALKSVSDAFDSIVAATQGVVDIAGALWSEFGDDVIAVVENIVETIGPTLDGIADAIQGMVDVVAGIITGDWGRAWDGIESIVDGAWRAIKALIGGAIDQLKIELNAAWTAIKNTAGGAWTSIKTAITDAAGAAVAAVQGNINDLGGWLGGAWNTIRGAATSAWNAFRGNVVDPVTDAVSSVKSKLGQGGDGLASWLLGTWNAIRGAANTAWDVVKGHIVEPITDAVASVKSKLSAFGDGLGGWMVGTWNAIRGAANTAWDVVKGHIVDPITDAVSAVKSKLGQGADGLASWLAGTWGAIRGAANTAWDVVKGHIVDPITGAVSAVKSALGNVEGGLTQWLSSAWGNMRDGVSDFARSIKDKIGDAFGGAVKAVKGFIRTIVGVINKIPGVNISTAGLRAGGVVATDGVVDPVPGFAQGGTLGSGPVIHHDAFARGGQITRPMVVVGEEAPKHDEFVIPTNPAYRGRAIGLFGQLGDRLGVPGFVAGGILGGAGGIAGDIVGPLVELVKNGAGLILKQLPGVGSLPDWMGGMGRYVLDKAGSYIKSQVGNLIEGDTPGSLGPAVRIARMIKRMDEINAKGYPYVYGGGHGSFEGPYDCSGLVSAILHAGGFLSSPVSTDGLKPFGEPGDGKAITVGVRGSSGRSAHTMMRIGNKYLESGSGHGAKWVGGWSGNFPIHRHPAGYAMGGIVDQLFDPDDPAFLGWGLREGGTLPFVGSYRDGGVVPADGMAYVHKDETITPAASVPEVRVFIGDRELTDIVRVEVDSRDRRTAGQFMAGVRA